MTRDTETDSKLNKPKVDFPVLPPPAYPPDLIPVRTELGPVWPMIHYPPGGQRRIDA